MADHAINVLLVEDDEDIRTLVARYLQSEDIVVHQARDGADLDRALMRQRAPTAETVLTTAAIDLIVLDVNLPGEDGFDICTRLRRSAAGPPIIMLTARGEDVDRILGLELGADDYLTKPFNPRELLARIRAVLRRSAVDGFAASERTTFVFDGFRLDGRKRQLFDSAGVRVVLTGSEYEVLRTLLEVDGRVLSREELRAGIAQSAHSADRSIDIVVSRLRQKIEPDPRNPTLIQTIRSLGYMLTPAVTRL